VKYTAAASVTILGMATACQGVGNLLDRADVDQSPEAKIVFETIKAATLDDGENFDRLVEPSATILKGGHALAPLRSGDLNRFTFCALTSVASRVPQTADATWSCTTTELKLGYRNSVYRFAVGQGRVRAVREVS